LSEDIFGVYFRDCGGYLRFFFFFIIISLFVIAMRG
jgi:hypothetical protein